MFAIITVRKALHVVDLNGVDGMADIRCEGDTLTLGAMCRQRTVERSAEVSAAVPLVVEALGNVGHPAIRNRGTVGGSIAHADPAAEMPAVALCLDAEMVAQGPAGGRVIPATEFFDGFLTTALAEEEVLTGIRFPVDGPGSGSAFAEVARRHGDFAMAGVAVHVRLDGDTVVEARIAVSGVGLTPVRATEAESSLRGATAAEDAFAAAAAATSSTLRPATDRLRPGRSRPGRAVLDGQVPALSSAPGPRSSAATPLGSRCNSFRCTPVVTTPVRTYSEVSAKAVEDSPSGRSST
ncbi:MAG: FAD binding domain-containing protein [Pseudonocardia sp.]|nr:FAD binding domain-containing protein [Pseudonocardia sp.]